jgi:hypothetical protein
MSSTVDVLGGIGIGAAGGLVLVVGWLRGRLKAVARESGQWEAIAKSREEELLAEKLARSEAEQAAKTPWVKCRECQKLKPLDEVIEVDGGHACDDCTPSYCEGCGTRWCMACDGCTRPCPHARRADLVCKCPRVEPPAP